MCDTKKAEKVVVAKVKEEAKAVKDAEKAAVAKVKEDVKIAKEMVKEVKKATMAGHGGAVVGHGGAVVGHGGATFVEPVTEQQATVEPVMVVPAISPGSQQRHKFPEEATPWVLIEHLI